MTEEFERIQEILQDNGVSSRFLTNGEVWRFQQAWREVFSAAVKERTGKWVHENKDWHSFSYGFVASTKGFAAELAYERKVSKEFILLISNEHSVGCFCTGDVLPAVGSLRSILALSPKRIDLYLFPCDLRWSLVITHDERLGPFFAIAPFEPQ